MKVNFNNLRLQALIAHDKLVYKLNEAVLKNTDDTATPNGFGHSMNLENFVLIDADELSEVLNDLRMMIGSIASVYEPGDADFEDVYSKEYAGEKRMARFNDSDDND